ncbi:MAG: trypsin-like peptidase domain-containing protein [Planctomycetes bacterium]|nr:trypsin-like peptidase domain-containing protein [Planctomycetota bacterium]
MRFYHYHLAVALTLFGVAATVCLAASPTAVPRDIPQYLQDISVTIRTPQGEGSGVLRRTKDGTTWVWTAAHVVENLRKTRQVINPKTGSPKTVVAFDDAKVLKLLIENGRTVGRIELDAEVIRYSDASHGEDLAVLRIRKKQFVDAGVNFYLEKDLPARGTELYHCGSLLGEFGASSLTQGIVSQYGRLIDGKVYDQVSTPSFPGSSGGGVYLKADGRLIGLLVRGTPGGFSLIVPVRRMEAWAKKAKVEWAIRDNVPLPGREELEKQPVEDESPGR